MCVSFIFELMAFRAVSRVSVLMQRTGTQEGRTEVKFEGAERVEEGRQRTGLNGFEEGESKLALYSKAASREKVLKKSMKSRR